MGIAILIVQKNLKTEDALVIGSIETEDAFCYDMQSKAYDLNLMFIKTIDPYGVTLINPIQAHYLEKEIHLLRVYPALDQSILDLLQEAVIQSLRGNNYILFFGD